MEAFLHPPIFIFRRHPPNIDQQIVQGLTGYVLAILREDPREDARGEEFTPVFDNDSSQSLIIRTTANGALNLCIRDGNLAPQLLEQAVVAARPAAEARALEAKSRAFEAKSRAIRNIVVPVLAVAAFVFVAIRPRP